MAKHAARRKPGAVREAAWPETGSTPDPGAAESTETVRPMATTGATDLASIGVARARKRAARRPAIDAESAIDAERNAAILMGEALTSGFRKAVQAAVLEAHAEGLAVPVRVDGIAVEIRPDGAVVPIDDHAPWSPVDWRKAATR
ncbi:MAG: hypothetical protein ABSE20_11055 [Acetobacteraceae bacterium]